MKHHLLFKNAAYYMLSGYLLMPLSIISSILMRRWLDPHIYGVIATLNLFVMYSIFSSLGTLSAAEVTLPFYRGEGNLERLDQIKSTSFTFVVITGAIFSIGVVVWAIAARSYLDSYLFLGLLVFSVYFLLNQIASYYITLLRSTSEFIFLSKYQLISGALGLVGSPLAVWFFGYKGFLAVSIIVVIFQVYILYRKVDYTPVFGISWANTKILLMGGIPMLIMGLTAQGMKTIDNLLVLKLLDIEQLGYYTVALMANGLIFSVTNSLSNVLFPSMQEAYGRSGTAESLSAYIVRPSIIIGVLLPVMIGMLYFSLPLVVHWLTPKFEPGIPAFKIIVLSTYFFAMTNMTTGYLTSIGKQKIVILINAATLLLIICLAIVINRLGWGLIGISLVTGIGYLVCFIMFSSYVLRHWAGWNQTVIFLKDTTLPFSYSLLLILAIEKYCNLVPIGDEPDFLSSILQLLIFAVLYFPCILFFEKKTRMLSDFIVPLFRKLRKF